MLHNSTAKTKDGTLSSNDAMKISDIRTKYIDFFAKRGHAVIPSASLVPHNDPTTLFTGSGMQPILPYLLGEPHPEGSRIVDSQKSFRAEDIEEIGDNRHTTFFEMLGNWSFGDYFKEEQLSWIFEFLTDVAGLNPRNIYVTAFIGDDDLTTHEFWQITGNAGEGSFMSFNTDPRSKPEAADAVKRLRASGFDPEGTTLYTYAAVQVMAEAIRRAGAVDLQKTVAALHDGSYSTVIGPISFDPKGDVTKPDYIVYQWTKGVYAPYADQ
jgi:hypothetical protein